MKVLFLDIDGVLNGIDYVRSFGKFAVIVNPEKMLLLKEIINRTNAKIVLSSSWREHWDCVSARCDDVGRALNRIFGEYRLEIYDKTPLKHGGREEEIKAWLSDYPNVTHFAILDDVFRGNGSLAAHFVMTSDDAGGISETEAQTVISILNQP